MTKKRELTEEEKNLLKEMMRDVTPLARRKKAAPLLPERLPRKKSSAYTNELLTTLDLHGLTHAEAHARLSAFIELHVQAGSRHLLVITGKGRKGAPTLQQEVPRWLMLSDMKQWIHMVSTAKPQDGGEGALYVQLTRKKK